MTQPRPVQGLPNIPGVPPSVLSSAPDDGLHNLMIDALTTDDPQKANTLLQQAHARLAPAPVPVPSTNHRPVPGVTDSYDLTGFEDEPETSPEYEEVPDKPDGADQVPVPDASEMEQPDADEPGEDVPDAGLDPWDDAPPPIPHRAVPKPKKYDPIDDEDDDEDLSAPKSGLFSRVSDAWSVVWRKAKNLPTPAKIALALVMVFVLVGILVSRCGGSPPPAPEDQPGPSVPSSPPVVGGEPPPKDEELQPDAVSQGCGPPEGNPSLAFDHNKDDAWTCPRVHGIDGGVMNIQYSHPVIVCSITVVPGFARVDQGSGRNYWLEYRITTQILWRIGGRQFVQDITNPSPSGNTIDLRKRNDGKCVGTTVMSLQIQHSVTAAELAKNGPPAGPGGGVLNPRAGDVGINTKLPDVQDATAISSVSIMGQKAGD